MSADQCLRRIRELQGDIAKLQERKAREAAKIAALQRKASTANEQATRASSPSVLSSRLREVERAQKDIAAAQKEIAKFESEIGSKQRRLNDAGKDLAREQQRDRHRSAELAKEQDRRVRGMSSQLTQHERMLERTMRAVADLRQLPEKIVVLMLSANPTDQTPLRLDEEARAIGTMIRSAEHRDALRLESRWAARPLDLLQAINETRPRIVHFSGHGSDRDELVFQGEDGSARLVSQEAIVQTMAAAGDIRLVFFNACFSATTAEAVVQHVEAAIGMDDAIGDGAARVFAAQFYSAVGFGQSVQRAFDQARAALLLEGISEEKTPRLFVAQGLDASQIVLVRPAGLNDH